ncbi:ribosomal protein S18-alanine N-acetyltransferase [Acetobacter sp.]|uniref:ribosomal protein S18-alanine N-acetyltransferase n=1 Tax=Acetobacter sp. TaxID=440 RepID=UPI0039E948A0
MTEGKSLYPVIEEVGSAFSAVLAALQGAAFAPSARWQEKAFSELFATPGVTALLGSIDGTPVGFVLARSVADEAEILTLAVSPSCQRRGVARALMEKLMTLLAERETERLFLEVSVNNCPARALYTACGFTCAGTRKRYYEDGSDAEVMVREISSSSGK